MVATVANSYRPQQDKGVMDDMDDMEDQPVVMELPADMDVLPQDDVEERPEQDEHSLGHLTKETTADPEMERKRREWARLSARQALEAEEAALRAQQFRRATTVAVPLTAMKRQVTAEEDRQTDDDESDVASPASVVPALPRSKSWSCPRRAAAVEAIERRQVRFRFSTAASARESVREMHQLRFREFPIEACVVAPRVRVQVAGGVWRSMAAELGRDGFYCHRTSTFRKATKGFRIGYDDLIGASIKEHSKHNQLVLHYMRPGRGDKSRRLMRQYATLELRFESRKELSEWRGAVQVLVKWAARVPMNATRRIKVVVNPHSGKRRGRQVWRKWAPLLALAGIECDVEETTYGGHARDLGAAFDPSQKYEALVFVGGDGTVNEFMNGVFSRPEAEWRHLVATTPISLLCAGTDNAFGSGVGIPTHEAAVFCIIKRKIRPLDVMAVEGQSEDGSTRREFSCTGISWGVGSDIALESEATRWLGVHRYKYLKVKRGVLAPRKHVARVQYVLSDSVPTDEATGEQVLRTFDELRDRDADDQHHIELCSVYDESEEEVAKQWQGDARAILHPASEDAYAGQWREEENQFTTFGASNVYFEAKYSHPSDGNLDMIFSRKGGFRQTLELLLRYAAGDMLRAELVGYYKVKALVIDPVSDTPLNVDGEVFPLPGPFRIEVVPQLLCVLSEK